MPFYGIGSGVSVELVANVNEVLSGSHIDVVDGREVKDDGLEGRKRRVHVIVFLAFAWAGVIPWPITWSLERMDVGPARFLEDGMDHVIKIVTSVGIIVALGEAVDEDAGVRPRNFYGRIGAVIVVNGQENVSRGKFRVLSVDGRVAQLESAFAHFLVLDEMVTNDRMHLDPSEETATGFEQTKAQQPGRDSDRDVDAVLDAGEDSDKDASQEDGHLQRRNAPELVQLIRGHDQIENGMNNDRCKDGIGDVEEDGGEGVDGKKDDDGRVNTCERGPHTGFGLDGRSRE